MYPVIRLSDHIYLPTYFTVIALAYCLAILFLKFRTIKFQQNSMIAMELAVLIMVIGFVGSRLFHVFYEMPQYYIQNPLDILKVWQGGFVFYGGALSSVAICLAYLKYKKEPIGTWLDIFAPVIPLTYFLGRFATLLSGSGFGKPTDLPWGIIYPPGTEAPSGIPLHPTPIYAMIWEVGIFICIQTLENTPRWKKKLTSGSLFYVVMILHGLGRLTIEQFRNDMRGAIYLNLTISSWVSLFIILLGMILLIKNHRDTRTKIEHRLPN